MNYNVTRIRHRSLSGQYQKHSYFLFVLLSDGKMKQESGMRKGIE